MDKMSQFNFKEKNEKKIVMSFIASIALISTLNAADFFTLLLMGIKLQKMISMFFYKIQELILTNFHKKQSLKFLKVQ